MTMRARPGRKRIQSELLTGGERALRDALGQVDEVLGIAFEVQTTKGGTAAIALDPETGTLQFRDGKGWREIGGQQGSTEQPAGNPPAETGYLTWGSNSGIVTCPFTFASDLTVGGDLSVGTFDGILNAASGAVGIVGIGSSLNYSGGALNTIQGIRTADTPEFAGLTLTAFAGLLKAVAGVLTAAVKGTDYPGLDFANVFTENQTVNGTMQASGYKSSDGTPGATEDVDVAKAGGGTRTLHFKNGLYTGYTDS